MKFTTVQKAYIALIIANIIWGAASPIFKWSLENIPPFTLAFWRFFLGLFLLLAYLRGKAALPTKTKKDLAQLILYAVFGITINIIFFFWGLRLTYAINSPVISSAQPILTLFFAMLFLREKFIWKKFLGMILGVAGILVIVIQPLLQVGIDGSLIGNIFLVIATVAVVGQNIVGKDAFKKQPPVTLTFWAFVIGAASFLPLAIYEYATIPRLYQSLNFQGYAGVAFGAIFSSTLGYTLYAWGLSKISASETALFTYVDPIAGTILAFFLLHEPITSWFLWGTALIFLGIFVAEGRFHYHPVYLLRKMKKITKGIKEIEEDSSVDANSTLKRLFKRP